MNRLCETGLQKHRKTGVLVEWLPESEPESSCPLPDGMHEARSPTAIHRQADRVPRSNVALGREKRSPSLGDEFSENVSGHI